MRAQVHHNALVLTWECAKWILFGIFHIFCCCFIRFFSHCMHTAHLNIIITTIIQMVQCIGSCEQRQYRRAQVSMVRKKMANDMGGGGGWVGEEEEKKCRHVRYATATLHYKSTFNRIHSYHGRCVVFSYTMLNSVCDWVIGCMRR